MKLHKNLMILAFITIEILKKVRLKKNNNKKKEKKVHHLLIITKVINFYSCQMNMCNNNSSLSNNIKSVQ